MIHSISNFVVLPRLVFAALALILGLPSYASSLSDGGPGGPKSILAADKKVKSNTVKIKNRIARIGLEPPLFNLPLVDAGAQQVLPAGSPPRLLNGIPLGGNWSGPGVSPTGVFTPSSCGSFTLYYEVPGLGKDSMLCTVLNDTLTSNPLSITGPDAVCSGNGSVTFSASPAGGSWSSSLPATGIFDPAEFNGNALQIQYSATVNGCDYALSKSVAVYPATLSLNSGGNTDLCLNQTLLLQVSPQPPSDIPLKWYRNDTLLPTEVSPVVITSTAGIYRAGLLLKNSLGDTLCTINSDTLTLSASGNTAPAAPQLLRNGNQISSQNHAGSDGFSWYLNGDEISGAIASVYTPQLPGIYHATYRNGNCTSGFSNAISIQTITSLDEQLASQKVKIFPNPVSRFLQIRQAGDSFSARLMDVLGREFILQQEAGGQIDLIDFPAGVYFLNLLLPDQTSYRFRLLKEK